MFFPVDAVLGVSTWIHPWWKAPIDWTWNIQCSSVAGYYAVSLLVFIIIFINFAKVSPRLSSRPYCHPKYSTGKLWKK